MTSAHGTNRVHPTAVIGPGVELGGDNVIGPYAVLLGPARIGNGNWIGPHTAIGTPGEMRGGDHPTAWDEPAVHGGVVIGDRNVIREFATVQAPAFGQTIIGDDCYVMTKAHVPHDGVLSDGVTVSCGALIGGHGRIGANANLGLNSVLHQELVVGPGAMLGMGTIVTKAVPPYATVTGNPGRVRGVNWRGMQRVGCSDEAIEWLRALYVPDTKLDQIELVGEPSELTADVDWYRSALEAVASSH
ncbi:MAG TPA: hypothetical protein PKY13_07825 [Microthrixaceae bacterium]|jgi:UDP-N-acetylglucosamine acyltransferase|nr:hypothetical protein [Microthrixaceae bacterium]HQF95366.1 hypothetical protein [Microthrixaceae bacterium]